MGWETNILTSQYKGKLPLQSFNQLQLALKERCSFAGVSVPAILNEDYQRFGLIPENWFEAFQNTVTELVPKFVNHTKYSVKQWDGTGAINYWNLNDMGDNSIIEAIGDSSRIDARNSFLCAKWCYQQYKIINMLLYRISPQRNWSDMTVTPSGDVWACTTRNVIGNTQTVIPEDVYKQVSGSNDFVPQNFQSVPSVGGYNYGWWAIEATQGNDIYVSGAYIHKKTGGQGEFVQQGGGYGNWHSLAAAPSGNIYAYQNYYGDYRRPHIQTGGVGDFALSSMAWYGTNYCSIAPNGLVYCLFFNGSTVGVASEGGVFASLNPQKWWIRVTATLTGDVYAQEYGRTVLYKLDGNEFVPAPTWNIAHSAISEILDAPNGDRYVIANYYIFKQAGGVGNFTVPFATNDFEYK